MDIWGYACIIAEVHGNPVRNSDSLSSASNSLPKSLQPAFTQMIQTIADKRPSAEKILENCRKPNGYFKNQFVDALLFLDEIQVFAQMKNKMKFMLEF